MLTITAKHELAQLARNHYKKARLALEDQRQKIIDMGEDDEDQKLYWLHFNILDGYLSESMALLVDFVNELEKRGDLAEKESLKHQLRAARAYIKDMGGNPSILTYVTEEDLNNEKQT